MGAEQSGYEYYSSMFKSIYEKCSKLPPKSVNGDETTYSWNGMDITVEERIGGGRNISIFDPISTMRLVYCDSDFKQEFLFELYSTYYGSYSPDEAQCFLYARYNEKKRNDDITKMPNRIPESIRKELTSAEDASHPIYSDANNSKYEENLGNALKFLERLDYLTQTPGKVLFGDFCRENGIGTNEVAAYLAEQLAKESTLTATRSAYATTSTDMEERKEKIAPTIGNN